MGQTIEDLLAELRANPANVRFAELCRVATHFFGKPRNKGSSHNQAIDRLLKEKKP